MSSKERVFLFWTALAGVLLVSRLCHAYVLWADEDYHLAVGIQMLHGKMLYRDVWYDKPPLTALLTLLFGARDGWPLRVAGTAAALASCGAAFALAKQLWTSREGYLAAGLLAFYLVCYAPAAVIPFEPDTLMILPQLGAVYLAVRGRAWVAGVVSGIAFLLSPKGAFVLAACLVIHPAGWVSMLGGFVLPNLAALAWLGASGAFRDYVQQVWTWGALYAGKPGSDPQARHAWLAVPNWLGFHAALVIGAAVARVRAHLRFRLLAWAVISFVGAAIGLRFAPRYFDQLLPALVIPAAGGMAVLMLPDLPWKNRIAQAAIAIALVIPVARFAPRYLSLASDSLLDVPFTWTDVAMDQESRTAATLLRAVRKPGDTVFIWGYRPNLIVYTGLPVASKLWDSQPVTGVPADRHLSDSRPVAPEMARENRMALARTAPSLILDGLSSYNHNLDIHDFPELSEWLAHYCVVLRARNITVYRRCGS